MHIESLKLFCDLVETQSFTKAAQIHQITQSAASQHVRALERLFNSLFIEHCQKQFQLTPEGEVLLVFSRQIVQTYELMVSKIDEQREVIAGTIRLAASSSIGLHALPPHIARFSKLHPDVNLHVAYQRSNEVYEDVLAGVADMGLVSYPQPSPSLEVVPLWKERLVLICHPQHRLAQNTSIKLSDLAGEKFIGFEQGSPTRKAVDIILNSHRATINVVRQFDNIETLKRAVEIDEGLSLVPEATVIQELVTRTLASVELKDGEFFRPSAAIYRKDKEISPAIEQLLAILKGQPPPPFGPPPIQTT